MTPIYGLVPEEELPLFQYAPFVGQRSMTLTIDAVEKIMRHRMKSINKKTDNEVTSNDPSRIVLQLDEKLCVMNEVAPNPCENTNCLSKNHNLESDDVTKFLENDADKSIPILDGVEGMMASGVYLQPRPSSAMISDYENEIKLEEDIDTSSICDTLSLDCWGEDELILKPMQLTTGAAYQSSSHYDIETTFDDFAPLTTSDGSIEPPNEFRNVNVSIQIKELIGISRIVSRKKRNIHGIDSSEVKAVISYQGREFDVIEHEYIESRSLPVMFRKSKKKSTKVSAKWTDSSNLSTISFSRTIMKPHIADNIHDVRKKKQRDKQTSIYDQFAPEVATLQVSLQRGTNENIPFGIATVIIPWQCQDVDLEVPVFQSCAGEAIKKKKTLFTTGSSMYVHFANDENTRYKIEPSASLSVRLSVNQKESGLDLKAIADDGMLQAHSDRNRRWRILGAASSKLTLYQRLQLFTALGKQQGVGSLSSKSSSPNDSAALDKVQITSANTTQSIPIESVSESGASCVSMIELVAESNETDIDECLSEISDSSSSVSSSSSSTTTGGGTLTYSLHSNFTFTSDQLNKKNKNMTDTIIKLLSCQACDPTICFRGSDTEEEEKTVDSSSSCGTSLAGTKAASHNSGKDQRNMHQLLTFETPVHKLPSFDNPV
eukprot:scaffold30514_cov73-Cyclotella_meneghiniana.AAC.10